MYEKCSGIKETYPDRTTVLEVLVLIIITSPVLPVLPVLRCNSSIWDTGAVRFFRSVQLGPSFQWGSLFGSGRGFAFYLARYGNADREGKMCSWIKGLGLRAASVTLGNLDYGEGTVRECNHIAFFLCFSELHGKISQYVNSFLKIYKMFVIPRERLYSGLRCCISLTQYSLNIFTW